MKKKIMRFLYILAVVFIISGTLFILPGIIFAGDGPGPFTITVTAGSNGSISPGTSDAIPKNSDPIYTITASSGYNIESVTIDGASIAGPFTSPFTYTFVQVKEDHSIAASFAEIPPGTINVAGGTDVRKDWEGQGSENADLSGCTNGYWHWILTAPGSGTPTSGTLYVTYNDGSTSQTDAVNEVGSMHFHVYHSGAIVSSAYVIYSYTGDIHEDQVVLTISSSNCVDGETGILIIHKETDANIPAGTVFSFTVDGQTVNVTAGNGQLGQESKDLSPGSYTVTEQDANGDYDTQVSSDGNAYSNGDSIGVTITAGQTTEVWFYNDPSSGEELPTGGTTTDGGVTPTIEVATITEETATTDEGIIEVAAVTEETAEVVQVAAIEELPRTGNNMLFYVIGFALIAVGAVFGSFFIPKALRKR